MSTEKMKKAIQLLQESLKEMETGNNLKPEVFRNQMILMKASEELGTKEWRGTPSNPRVDAYFDEIDADGDSHYEDDTPWCAAFVGAILKRCRMGHTGKLNARSYEKWGVSTKNSPLPGDIVVYWRGSRNGWKGHVGFFLKHDNGYIYTLGGNQGDAVTVARYSDDRLLDIRRSSKHRELNDIDLKLLSTMKHEIVMGNKVDLSGKVV